MSLAINAYNGPYGPGEHNAPIVDITLSSSEGPVAPEVHVCLVIDTSFSMLEHELELKASLLTIATLIDELGEFGNRVKFTLITFDDTARVIWKTPEHPPERSVGSGTPYRTLLDHYKSAIDRIVVGARTNLYEGLETAFTACNALPNHPTWMVVMTDGDANTGACIAPDDLSTYLQRRAAPFASRLKVTTLGFGTKYNPETLSRLGEYTHVRDAEEMSQLFGVLIGEIQSAYCFDAAITLPVADPQLAYGRLKVGTLFQDRTAQVGWLLGNLRELSGPIRLSYTDFQGRIHTTDYTVDLAAALARDLVPPASVRAAYYSDRRHYLLTQLYNAASSKDSKDIRPLLDRVSVEVDGWEHPEATEHRSFVRALIQRLRSGQVEHNHLLASRAGIARQLTTPAQSVLSTRGSAVHRIYSGRPPAGGSGAP